MTQRFLLLFCLLAFFPSWSQVGTGSPYSFGGLGEINYRGNHWTRAMGGVEFYTDSIHVDFNNPASLSSLKMTNFSLGLDYRNTTLKDNQSTHAVTTSSLNYMGVSIPTKYFGFNFGLLPYSSVGYRQEYRNVEEEATEIQRYEGNGGLNMAFVSVGFKIHKWWSVGAMLRYGFGNITHRSSQLIENVDRTTFLESNSSMSGVSYKFSTLLKVPLGQQRLHFYSAYTPKATINSQNAEVFTTLSTSTSSVGQQLIVDLAASGLDETVMILPQSLSFGFGIGRVKKWFVGGQYQTIATSDFRNDFITLDGLSYENGNKKPFFADVDYDIAPVQPHAVWDGVVQKDSMWCYPHEGHYKMRLRQVRKNWDKWKKKAKTLRKWVLENFASEKQHKLFAESVYGEDLESWAQDLNSNVIVNE